MKQTDDAEDENRNECDKGSVQLFGVLDVGTGDKQHMLRELERISTSVRQQNEERCEQNGGK